MAITHVHTDYTGLDASSPGATVSMNMPAGGLASEIAIAVLCSANQSSTVGTWTAPAGWTQVFAHVNDGGAFAAFPQLDIACFWALANVGNPTFTKSGNIGFVGGVIVDFAGCNTTNPIDAAGTESTAASSPLTVNAVTPNTTGAIEIVLCTDIPNGSPSITGFTRVINGDVNQLAALLYLLTALTSGVSTGTKSLADAAGSILAIPFLLKPAAGTPTIGWATVTEDVGRRHPMPQSWASGPENAPPPPPQSPSGFDATYPSHEPTRVVPIPYGAMRRRTRRKRHEEVRGQRP